MIEIIAIVRPNKTSATKQALIKTGYPGYTCIRAVGRGKKTVEVILADGKKLKTKLVSKRLFLIVVEDVAKEEVVQAIIDANWSGNEGDGKIFVTKLTDSYNVHLE
ncbi:P-II family nitrogen regulator [Enterococcus olivae]